MDRKVAERHCQHTEHVSALGITISKRKPKVRFVTTSQKDITRIQIRGNIVRVTKQLRKRTLNNSHNYNISELLQISTDDFHPTRRQESQPLPCK